MTDPRDTLPPGYEPKRGEYHVTITYDPVTERRHPWLVETFVFAPDRGGWTHPLLTVSEGSVLYPRAREHWNRCLPHKFGSPLDAVKHRHKVLEPYEAQVLTDTVRRKEVVPVTLPR